MFGKEESFPLALVLLELLLTEGFVVDDSVAAVAVGGGTIRGVDRRKRQLYIV